MRFALLAVAVALAGCADPGGFGFSRETGTQLDPYFHEYREVVAGQHAKTFDVPVDAPAALVNVTMLLDARTHGLPVPDASPAQLDVRLLDPTGAPVKEARVDARAPQASLVATDLAPGLYRVEVEGFGASQQLDGQEYGAGYVVTIEILYAQ